MSLQTKINPHPEFPYSDPGTGHADELQFLFRCLYFKDAQQKIKEDANTDPESAMAFRQMNVLQTLYANFIKYG